RPRSAMIRQENPARIVREAGSIRFSIWWRWAVDTQGKMNRHEWHCLMAQLPDLMRLTTNETSAVFGLMISRMNWQPLFSRPREAISEYSCEHGLLNNSAVFAVTF